MLLFLNQHAVCKLKQEIIHPIILYFHNERRKNENDDTFLRTFRQTQFTVCTKNQAITTTELA